MSSSAPRPYFEEGWFQIFHGDCAEIAPALGLTFDLLCTDPPYGIGEARCRNKGQVPRAGGLDGAPRVARRDYGSSTWDDAPPPQGLIDQLKGLARWQCIFGGNYFMLPPSSCWLVWDKGNGGTAFADAELAWTNYGTATRLKRYQWSGMLRGGVAGKSAEPRFHPTQKPLAVMAWAISKCPEAPTSVFDPFLGSGTTLRACKDLGIPRAIGIEADERYCEIAARRLAQGVLF